MFDLSVTECTKGMYIYCYMLFLFVIAVYWKIYNNRTKRNKLDYFFFLLLLIYVTTSFYNGDFWHLQDYLVYGNELWKPSEPIYDIIFDAVGNNYLLFRIIVWGGGLLLLLRIFKLYSLNINIAFYYFFALYISVFDYARASLAMAVYFLGFSLLTTPYKKFSLGTKITGIFLLLLSSLFHTSLLAVILLTFVIWIPVNKKTIIFLCVAFPIFSYIIKFVVFNFILSGGASELIFTKIATLVEIDAEDKSLLEKVRMIWHYSTFFIPFIIVTKYIYFRKETNTLPSYSHKLYKITLGIIIIALSTLFLGLGNNVLFYRYLYMSMIPITVLICSLKECGVLPPKTYKNLILFGVLYIIFRHSKVLLAWQGPLS